MFSLLTSRFQAWKKYLTITSNQTVKTSGLYYHLGANRNQFTDWYADLFYMSVWNIL